jgi:hypothetical protein
MDMKCVIRVSISPLCDNNNFTKNQYKKANAPYQLITKIPLNTLEHFGCSKKSVLTPSGPQAAGLLRTGQSTILLIHFPVWIWF